MAATLQNRLMTSTSLPVLTTRTLHVPSEFFGVLRNALGKNPEAVSILRDSGYAAGMALYDSFGQWLDERGEGAPEDLPDDRFSDLVSGFFVVSGWGSVTVSSLSEVVIAVDSNDWGECDDSTELDAPSCHVTTGILAAFFGRLADATLAVMEIECRSSGNSRCRFLIGSEDVLAYVHEAVQRGVSYESAATSAATG